TLKEDADIFGRQHVLVEHQPAAGDLPGAIFAAQQVAAGADKKILFAGRPAAIDDEVAIDRQLGLVVARLDLDIGEQVAGARWRVFRPGHAGIEPRNAGGKRLLVLIEDRELV